MCFWPQRRPFFLHIRTSKSGPRLSVFLKKHSDLKMCFAPQRRAMFRHRNFQKWSEPGVFCTCCLQNMLRATAACNFSFLIWPGGSAPATVPPSRPTNHWKNTVFRDFPNISLTCILFLLNLSLSLFTLLFSAFHLSILSEVWLLNFLWQAQPPTGLYHQRTKTCQ